MQATQINNIISQLAGQLPIVWEHTHEDHFVDGAELIEQGQYELSDGTKVVAGITYKQAMPVMIAKNHERRLRKAYQKNGNEGLIKYITDIKNIVNDNRKGE